MSEWNSTAGAAQAAAELIARMVAAVELTPLVAVSSMDRTGRVHFWNRACFDMYGISVEEAQGRDYGSLVWPVDGSDGYGDVLECVWRDGKPSQPRDWRVQTANGRQLWTYSTLLPIHLGGVLQQVCRMDVDITARKRQEAALQLAAQVFENSPDAILLTDQRRLVLSVNRAYSDVTGYTLPDMLGQPLAAHRGGIEDEEHYRQVWAAMDKDGHWQGEIGAQHKDGRRYPAWLSLRAIRDGSNDISNYMLMLSDISARKKTEEHTRHLAEHDFLTDLPNRVLLLDRLSLALASARRKGSMLALLFLDLDRFKYINDTLGHAAGDQLLQEVAARLVKCVRGVDTVSRQGGDEFVILLAEIGGIEQAAHVADTILQAISQDYMLEGQRVSVSVSIGISLFPGDGDDIETLTRNADLAMYSAKDGGRSRFRFFDPEMNARAMERVGVENALRQALKKRQFQLAFDPVIEIGGGRVAGAEALLRWRHPEQGLLLPERFLGAAEDSGLIRPIGAWVLRQACREARRWNAAGRPMAVAVNLSMAEFTQKDLAAQVRAALARHALPPERLELEVTEATLMRQGGAAQETLQALRALGVHLTIDNFGTGYSHLGQMKDYPVDKLKIDRSFLTDLDGEGSENAAVVGAIIAMAHSLHMKVAAEGVETAAQLDFLRRHGCDQYQGRQAGAAAGPDALPGASRG